MTRKEQSATPGWKALLALLPLLLAAGALPAQEELLTIEAAVRLALERNERAMQADELYAAARARVAKALSYFFPNFTASGTYTRRPYEVTRQIGDTSIVIQSYDALAGNISLNMILFDSATIPGFNSARLASKSEKLNAAETKRKLAFEVATSYLMTLGVDQVLEASRHRFEYAQKNMEAARTRYDAGLVSINEVTRVELEVATAERGVIEARGQVESTFLHLGYLLDAPVSKLQAPEFLLTAAELSPPEVETLIPDAFKRRLDIQVLQLYARSLRAGMATPTFKWLPSLNLTGQYRYTNEAGLTGRTTNWNVGLSASWILFDGLNRNADFRERRALARLAELDAKAVKRRSEVEVRDAWVSLANQQAAMRQASVALDVAQRNAREISELYRQGLANALQAADANVRLFESEVAMVTARTNLAVALLNLRAAQGLDPFGKEPKT